MTATHKGRLTQKRSSSALLDRTSRPVAVGASGSWIWDEDDNRYLDASSGAVVSCLGHGRPEVIAAATKQLHQLDSVHRGQFENRPAKELAERLVSLTGMTDGRCYFFSSGSEAVEAAIKIAHIFQKARGGKTGGVLARRLSYHGATLEALRHTGHRGKRGAMDDILEYYPKMEGPSDTGQEWVDPSLTHLDQLEFGFASAVLLETVLGAAGGARVPARGFYEGVREYCDRTGAVWIADEVMTGVGRTGKWFAYQHWSAQPDIVCIGKALGAGYIPISAVVVDEEISRTVLEHSAAPVGHTYSNHPPAAAVGLAVTKYINDHALLEQVERAGVLLEELLKKVALQLDGTVHGLGLMRALHFDPQQAGFSTGDLVNTAMSLGLLIYPSDPESTGDTAAVLVCPPYTVTDAEIHELASRLDLAIKRLTQ